MDTKFREQITDLGKDSVDDIKKYRQKSCKDKTDFLELDRSLKILNFAIKVEHMNQIYELKGKDFNLQVCRLVAKDPKERKKYIEMTNTELVPILKKIKIA